MRGRVTGAGLFRRTIALSENRIPGPRPLTPGPCMSFTRSQQIGALVVLALLVALLLVRYC